MTSPAPVSFADVQKAAFAIAGTLQRTPLVAAPALSARLGCTILLKLETQQATGSFKERGALVKLAALTPEERRRGVIACSAGNHAQGVAYHARRLGIAATIVMPQDTPFSKVARTEAHGAAVRLAGRDLDAAEAEAHAVAARDGLVFVHPYDDP
ncbi:MAG: pyridoxal-phosphate dependent enzyme, partial [Alphaproteobacteria bacterium]|nr:pyridoxal-phosphate dependent enzyme [Alphaproteobacteria bacterium]